MGKRGVINPIYGMTNAAFFGKIRSSLRQQWGYSKPHKDAMKRAKVPYVGEGKRRVSVRCEKCHTEYDEKGNPIRSIGTVLDITETKIAEQKLVLLKRHTELKKALEPAKPLFANPKLRPVK